MAIPCMFVNGTLTMILNGNNVIVDDTHPKWDEICGAIASVTECEMLDLLNYREKFVNELNLDENTAHPTILKRIDEHIDAGVDPEYLQLFLDNVSENPSYQSQQELYDFLEHQSLPITPDGCFLAYKAVKENYMDKHTGTISNHVGAKVKMKRSKVDDNRDVGCSKGLHAGALSYAQSYKYGNERMVIVKINPKDVVSVPKECSCKKVRLCYYEVVSDFEEELMFAVYDEEAKTPITGTKLPTLQGIGVDTLPELDCLDDCWDDGDVENVYEDGENPIDPNRPMNDRNRLTGAYEVLMEAIDNHKDVEEFGLKPDGRKYHNKRGCNGRFAPRK